jgi:hypothetical protein|tara:strand:- start:754 stop:1683 length:930 start_codon:yes stop_codon:yes gene_type:complete
MNWNAVQKSLRQFAGINLDKNRKIPSNWVVVKEEMVIGDNSTFIVRMAVFPETFTGFSKGIGQQNKSVGKNLGIEIEVEDMGTGEYGSDRTFSDISFDRQNEFFQEALGVISRTITSVSSISAPQERQGSLSQVGVQRNPADWMVGDKVNVARESLDAGGLTVGYVVRVYPTSVDVLFPPDEYHDIGWTVEEEKDDLIYTGHDNNWRNVVNKWLKKQFYADGIQINENPPSWTKMISHDKAQYKRHIGEPSPIPITADVWTEAERFRDNLIDVMTPYRLYDEPITLQDIQGTGAIEGFQPMTANHRRRL